MEGATKKIIRKPPLEYYMAFLENPKQVSNLNKDQLNQIINIHGFQIPLHYRKNDLVEALSSINLLSPIRSTLKENVSCASLSFEELIQDSCSIHWHDDDDDDVKKVKSSFRRKRKQPLQESNTFVVVDPVDTTIASTVSCVSHGSF